MMMLKQVMAGAVMLEPARHPRQGGAGRARPAGQPQGCMVVTAATNTSAENAGIADGLAQHRRARTQAVIERLRAAQLAGELNREADVQALGDYYAALLHGLSVQARDAIPAERLLALIAPAMAPLALEMKTGLPC